MLTLVVAIAGTAIVAFLVRFAKRVHALDRARVLAPARSRVPTFVAAPVRDALDAAGVTVPVHVALQCWALAALVAGALASAVSFALGAAAAAAALAGAPIALHMARGRARRKIAAAVPDLLDRCAIELRGGGTVHTALDGCSAGDGPLGGDVRRVCGRIAVGASITEALDQWTRERDAPGVRAAAGALALAASVGGACADALEALAASLRARLAVIAEAEAMSAQARLSAVVVGVAPIGFLAWSAVVDPGPLRVLTGSFAGRLCLVAALVLEALALVWSRRVLREETAWS